MVVPLDDPPAGGSAPVLAKRKVETGAAEAAHKTAEPIGQARRRGGFPACGRRVDFPAWRRGARLDGGAVTDQKAKAGDAAAHAIAGGERKPAGHREVRLRARPGQFGDDTAERPAAERVLHGG